MILEGIVTTLNDDHTLNIAPMGPIVDHEMRRFVLRPYKTATTYHNLKERGEGVLHVTDDVLLLAKGAIGREIEVETQPAARIDGRIIASACRYYEFRVAELDDRDDRARIVAETMATGRLRDFFGFNRAKHAVVEAAILATRVSFLPPADILTEYRNLSVLVDKTGGPQEQEAFALLEFYVKGISQARGSSPEGGGL
jgi:hypothetical protein